MNPSAIFGLYSPMLAFAVVSEFRDRRYSGWRLLWWFWHAKSYRPSRPLNEVERSGAVFLGLGMLVQIAVGVGFLVEWARYGTAGAWEFGLALLLAYPLLWPHAVVAAAWLGNLIWSILHPKKTGRAFVCTILEYQVRRLRARHNFMVVAVAGSVGKTSTKLAVAELLGQTKRVRYQTGNYNDRVTVPLVFFGQTEPHIYNVFAWLKIFGASQSDIALPYPYDVVVVELGTDGPGQMRDFAYLQPDITVITAISAEHMEQLKTLDGVAAEELTVFSYSKRVLVNGDDIAGSYLAGREFTDYSLTSRQAVYTLTAATNGLHGQKLRILLPGGRIEADVVYLGEQGAKVSLAAAAVGDMIGLTHSAIKKGLARLKPFSGRMQIMVGTDGATLIDDTYNASPLAVKAALDVVYAADAKQKIAILGSMNELGAFARAAHQEVGAYCDPKQLDMVITIGQDAKKWLTPTATKQGCTVHSFMSPYEAGDFVASILKKDAVVLAKGSQNGVFAEEALKPLLLRPEDAQKLVRQSPYWLARKARQFPIR